jgi:hypothetical protein
MFESATHPFAEATPFVHQPQLCAEVAPQLRRRRDWELHGGRWLVDRESEKGAAPVARGRSEIRGWRPMGEERGRRWFLEREKGLRHACFRSEGGREK